MQFEDENGNWQEIYLEPEGDTVPIGFIGEYEGAEVPKGYEEVEGKGSISKSSYRQVDQTITGTNILTLYNTTGTIKTKGGKLLVIASCQAYNIGSPFAFTMRVKIGNNNYEILLSNSSSQNTLFGSIIIDNIPKGEYVTELLIVGTNTNSDIKVPAYSPYSYSIVEL